jgi:hypothetical protein
MEHETRNPSIQGGQLIMGIEGYSIIAERNVNADDKCPENGCVRFAYALGGGKCGKLYPVKFNETNGDAIKRILKDYPNARMVEVMYFKEDYAHDMMAKGMQVDGNDVVMNQDDLYGDDEPSQFNLFTKLGLFRIEKAS